MENRTYTMREVHILVDELLRAIEYNSAAPCNAPEQGDQATENEKLTLTVTEAAELLGISKPKMYELVRMNIFRSIKVGKKILISYKSFIEWIRNGDYDAKETSKW